MHLCIVALLPAPPPFATDWALCIDPGPNLHPLQGLLMCSTQLHLPWPHVAGLWFVYGGAVCAGPPQPLAHSPSLSSPAHTALCWPSMALPCCWMAATAGPEAPDSVPGQDTPTTAVWGSKGQAYQPHSSVGLNSPGHHQTATEADENQLHPVPFTLLKG